jgi:hypothetical protein
LEPAAALGPRAVIHLTRQCGRVHSVGIAPGGRDRVVVKARISVCKRSLATNASSSAVSHRVSCTSRPLPSTHVCPARSIWPRPQSALAPASGFRRARPHSLPSAAFAQFWRAVQSAAANHTMIATTSRSCRLATPSRTLVRSRDHSHIRNVEPTVFYTVRAVPSLSSHRRRIFVSVFDALVQLGYHQERKVSFISVTKIHA